ncbi:MAG TPA: SDR family NAD(P)-dependent oxidoreductase [Jatrophihabitantaceae bacterium]|jgi:NAD(P)-dependent dehydrogenase (short-subunit alcohol dehydrogenase family)
MKLAGKTVWVLGASSGIGAATARELVRRGARVAVSARRVKRLREVARDDMVVAAADVTDPASVVRAAAMVRTALGGVDVVIYSAGFWKQMDATAWDTELFEQHLRVNLTGLSNTLAAVLPPMLARGRGVIAGISSVAGYRGLAGSGGYGATKAAQQNLLESLRVQLAPRGIRVTTISPGFVRTELTADNRFPMPFLIDPEQAANAICDGLERERTDIVFPLPMALLMNAARLIPPRLWTVLWARPPERTAMQIRKTIAVDKPINDVFDFLSDFTTTTEWDPGTVQTVRERGDGGVGTEYLNTSRFLGRTTQLTYVVHELVSPRRIRLRGENRTVVATDTMTFNPVTGGTEVIYTAEFAFKGLARYLAPLLRPALRRLGDQAEAGMRKALAALPA